MPALPYAAQPHLPYPVYFQDELALPAREGLCLPQALRSVERLLIRLYNFTMICRGTV